MSNAKPCDKITPSDLEQYPVWTFDLANEGKPEQDETWMVPVKELPVSDLRNHCCLANARLACGRLVTVLLWEVRLQSTAKEEELRERYLQIRSARDGNGAEKPTPKVKNLRYGIWVEDRWWLSEPDGLLLSLVNYKKHSPSELAVVLGLSFDEVFPISYDISKFAVGPEEITKGKISA